MSGFEHYGRELAAVDHAITHWAAVCGIDPADRLRIEACRSAPHGAHPGDTPEETLRGLLMLRMKLETEMVEQGMHPPLFVAPTVESGVGRVKGIEASPPDWEDQA